MSSTPASHFADVPGVAMQLSRGIVVASIQVDLEERVLERFRIELLERIHESGSDGVIFDVSGLETIDFVEFEALRRIMTMVGLMGAESVLVGMRPGVVSSLIESGAEVEGLTVALDLDRGFALLEESAQEEAEPAEEAAERADEPTASEGAAETDRD